MVFDNSVQMLGPPPEGLTSSEALRQLRAFDGYGEDQTPSTVKPYDPKLLSVPEKGNVLVPLADLLGEDGQMIVGEFIRSRLLSEDEARRQLVGCGVECYTDPKLRNPKVHRNFVARLFEAALVDFAVSPPCEEVGAFFVGKKGWASSHGGGPQEEQRTLQHPR